MRDVRATRCFRPRVLLETDADLDVGEFGIATRMVQPDRRRGQQDEPAGEVEPGATMIYKPKASPPTQAVSPEELGLEQELVTLTVDGTRHEVKQRRVVLGRSKDCDIQLSDTNVSRRHAELRQEGASYWMVDLGSTNGMEVNGKRVKRAKLRDGDRVTLGSTDVSSRGRDDRRWHPESGPMIYDSAAVDEVLLVLKIAFLVLLYIFIWRIVRTASRDLRLPQESFILTPAGPAGVRASRSGPSSGRLIVVRSADLDEGEDFQLDSVQITIGRGGQNDIAISTDEYASARHARFEPRQDGVWVQDLGSTNGTFLNGARLDHPRRLSEGDIVRVGETDLRYEA